MFSRTVIHFASGVIEVSFYNSCCCHVVIRFELGNHLVVKYEVERHNELYPRSSLIGIDQQKTTSKSRMRTDCPNTSMISSYRWIKLERTSTDYTDLDEI